MALPVPLVSFLKSNHHSKPATRYYIVKHVQNASFFRQ